MWRSRTIHAVVEIVSSDFQIKSLFYNLLFETETGLKALWFYKMETYILIVEPTCSDSGTRPVGDEFSISVLDILVLLLL